MRTWNLLLLSISALLIVHGFCSVYHSTETSKEDVDLDAEELSFLEEDDIETPVGKGSHSEQLPYEEDDESENFDDFEEGSGDHDAFSHSVIDEKDVVVLTDSNFSDFIEKNQYVMVEFYAPWCGHCQTLAPEYAAAATELKSEAFLAKVDATEENDLAQKYNIQGFPTVLFFIDGVHKPYQGQRLKDAIVTWIKKKTGPGVYNITTVEDAKKILSSENKLVLGFLESLVGPESQELAAASKLEDDVNFYQTSSGDVAEIFHLNSESKRPSLVLIKNEEEKISLFDGQFTKSTIVEFVFANKLPLVITFSRDTAPLIFESSIKRQVLLFASSSDSKKLLPNFLEAAKLFKGKLIFLYVDMDNADVGKPVADYFGVTGDGPIVLAYEGNENAKKFILDGEITIDNIKTFGEGFLEDKLEPFYKSEPIPKSNDGDVRIVVGKSFDEIVLDESKDVLLEIYAPWCGHCQALEPIYKKLAKHLHGIESLVIAKMDATTNEHPRAKSDGFPTILFFPAGNKSFDPIVFDGDRTVVEMYKFIKKHASTPFKLQKPTSTLKKPEATLTIELPKSSSSEVRDEL